MAQNAADEQAEPALPSSPTSMGRPGAMPGPEERGGRRATGKGRLAASSTVRSTPKWTIPGRCGEPLIDFRLPRGQPQAPGQKVRARILHQRSAGTEDNPGLVKIKLRYLSGGNGEAWLTMDEGRQLLYLDGSVSVAFEHVAEDVGRRPGPGYYGITTTAYRYQKTPTALLGCTGKRGGVCTGGGPSPDPTAYSPPVSSQFSNAPRYGFGSASRVSKVRRDPGPEPGDYEQRNCWDGRRISLHGRHPEPGTRSRLRNANSFPGLDPNAYDPRRAFRLTREKAPAWRLDTAGGRSNMLLGDAPGPGTYDAKFDLTQTRVRRVLMTRSSTAPSSALPAGPPDPEFAHFSIFD